MLESGKFLDMKVLVKKLTASLTDSSRAVDRKTQVKVLKMIGYQPLP
jgi:hypothetical protein